VSASKDHKHFFNGRQLGAGAGYSGTSPGVGHWEPRLRAFPQYVQPEGVASAAQGLRCGSKPNGLVHIHEAGTAHPTFGGEV